MKTKSNMTVKDKEKKITEIELLKQEVTMLKNALCTCPHDGIFISCPIHGERMYGDMWRFKTIRERLKQIWKQ